MASAALSLLPWCSFASSQPTNAARSSVNGTTTAVVARDGGCAAEGRGETAIGTAAKDEEEASNACAVSSRRRCGCTSSCAVALSVAVGSTTTYEASKRQTAA